MKTIYFIYADGCKQCEIMKKILREMQFSQDHSKRYNVVEMDCETEDAVDYAVENGVSDLPACKVGDTIIEGEDFSESELKEAIMGFYE